MALRVVTADRVRRIAFSPKGTTVVLVNQDGLSDVYIFRTEEEGLNLIPTAVVAPANNLPYGTKLAANGGQLNWTNYDGELWAVASSYATPAAGGNAVLTANFVATFIRVLPG